METNSTFYVGVSDHVQLRRLLLECSKQILQSLQDYEILQSIREEKIEYIVELRHIIKEIYILNSRLGTILPKAQLRATSDQKPEMDMSSSRTKKQDLNAFEDELSVIEEKLKLLGG